MKQVKATRTSKWTTDFQKLKTALISQPPSFRANSLEFAVGQPSVRNS